MKQVYIYFTLISVLLLSACADSENAATNQETNGMRIISLMPSNTEILAELGFRDVLVGVTTSDDYPEDLNADIMRLDTFALDEESMMALNPTHILSHEAGHDANKDIIDRVANNTGADVLVVNDAQKINEIYGTIIEIGEFTGAEENARNLNESLQQEVTDIQQKYTKKSTDDKTLILISTTPDVYIAGDDTFIDDYLDTFNIDNVFSDVSGYPAITSEDLIARAPNKVISTLGIDKEALTTELKNISGLEDAPITQPENQCTPDPNLISRPGPRFTEGLTAVAECVYE